MTRYGSGKEVSDGGGGVQLGPVDSAWQYRSLLIDSKCVPLLGESR